MGIEKWVKHSTCQPKRAMGSRPRPCPSITAQTEARLVKSKARTWVNWKAHTRTINPYLSNTENRIFPKRYPIHPIKSHYKGNRRPSVRHSPIKKEDYSKQTPLTNPLLNLRLTIRKRSHPMRKISVVIQPVGHLL